jgi:UDP-N-acetylmuramyl pentapeptide phosphotransferase/UDP-N-acetylglucosamine-1-phosphate transferase
MEGLIMSFRSIVLIAASALVTIVAVAAFSTQSFARTPAGTTRLHHHHHHHHHGIHHSGQVRAPKEEKKM